MGQVTVALSTLVVRAYYKHSSVCLGFSKYGQPVRMIFYGLPSPLVAMLICTHVEGRSLLKNTNFLLRVEGRSLLKIPISYPPSLTSSQDNRGLSHQGLEWLLLLTPHTPFNAISSGRPSLRLTSQLHLYALLPSSSTFLTLLMTAVTWLFAHCLTSLCTVRLRKMVIVASLFSTI